jgi:hypothetical protein
LLIAEDDFDMDIGEMNAAMGGFFLECPLRNLRNAILD